MPSLGMGKPLKFDRATVDAEVPDYQIGNFALGYVDEEDNKFVPRYVGRSDGNLKEEIKNYLNPKYKHFKFAVTQSIRTAFEKECYNYHDFDGDLGHLDNQIHPRRPEGETWDCPVAGCEAFKKK